MARQSVSFNDVLDFTRASTATYFDNNGVLQSAAIDEPRFDHDPVTGEPLGVLIEESRTNLVESSEDITGAYWGKRSSVVSAELGGFRIERLDSVGGIGDAGVVSTHLSVVEDSTYTTSVDVKAGSVGRIGFSTQGNGFQPSFVYNIATNSFSGVNDDSQYPLSFSYKQLSNGWVRVSFTYRASSGDFSVYRKNRLSVRMDNSGTTDGDYFYMRRPQLEEGSYPTSYIPTNGTAVTRASDVLTTKSGV